MKRCSGILAHPTSFPSRFGIGDLGGGVYEFIDYLERAGQSLWQILPLGPTSFGDSPYQSFSTFTGNHYLISPDLLVKEGYLSPDDIVIVPSFPSNRVDYGPVIKYKMTLLHKAYAGFESNAQPKQRMAYKKFCYENANWLNDYALFMALKDFFIAQRRNEYESSELLAYAELNKNLLSENEIKDFYYGAVWNSWPDGLRKRDPKTLAQWETNLSDATGFYKFTQFEFNREWNAVREYAHKKEIQIIGDIPIFVAMDSSDVWSHNELFQLDKNGYPEAVAGVPPDYFSATGQLWGNPLYYWPAHKASGYEWWNARIQNALSLVDTLRIDHFRGFESYWSVPYGEKTAVNGRWIKGPGLDLMRSLGKLPIIAEDLGIITDAVLELRLKAGFPGMRVLQFAFGDDNTNAYLPHNFEDSRTVVYTGTHDNDTTLGWYATAPEKERDYFRRYLNVSGDNAAWDMIRLAYSSIADYAVVPIQDVMRLGGEARMNTPGEAEGNWQFRFTPNMLTDESAKYLKYLCEVFYR